MSWSDILVNIGIGIGTAVATWSAAQFRALAMRRSDEPPAGRAPPDAQTLQVAGALIDPSSARELAAQVEALVAVMHRALDTTPLLAGAMTAAVQSLAREAMALQQELARRPAPPAPAPPPAPRR